MWQGSDIITPAPVLWACELPSKDGIAVITLFDETTASNQTNSFTYRPPDGFQRIEILEENRLVRFLGCYAENDKLVLNATNNMEYILDPKTLAVERKRYYR